MTNNLRCGDPWGWLDGRLLIIPGTEDIPFVIAVGKRNPRAEIAGIDRWGKKYASFSKSLCESNALAEGVSHWTFIGQALL